MGFFWFFVGWLVGCCCWVGEFCCCFTFVASGFVLVHWEFVPYKDFGKTDGILTAQELRRKGI